MAENGFKPFQFSQLNQKKKIMFMHILILEKKNFYDLKF